jgi:hypothetical protein
MVPLNPEASKTDGLSSSRTIPKSYAVESRRPKAEQGAILN